MVCGALSGSKRNSGSPTGEMAGILNEMHWTGTLRPELSSAACPVALPTLVKERVGSLFLIFPTTVKHLRSRKNGPKYSYGRY